jgi:hypothetical protein
MVGDSGGIVENIPIHLIHVTTLQWKVNRMCGLHVYKLRMRDSHNKSLHFSPLVVDLFTLSVETAT